MGFSKDFGQRISFLNRNFFAILFWQRQENILGDIIYIS